LTACTTRFDLADERVAEFIDPVGSPISDDVGISTNVGLGVVVQDLGSADFARIQSHLKSCGVADGTRGLPLKSGRSQESGCGKGGEGDKREYADESKAWGEFSE
jgi:hypothetical protein